MTGDNQLSLYAVGDVRPDWPNPDSVVEMELVQPISGKSVQREFLEKHG